MFGSCSRRGVLRGRGILASLALGIILPSVRAQQPRTVTEGVYSDSQAKSGQALYREKCAQCHAATLSGGVGPPLTGSEFNEQWGGRSLADLAGDTCGDFPHPLHRGRTVFLAVYYRHHVSRVSRLSQSAVSKTRTIHYPEPFERCCLPYW